MPAAPLPDNETERLAELHSYHILDTGADPRFNTFVRLASQLYDVPVAVVSLIDEGRQWFKAAVGIDITETPRELAFCAHAILAPNEVMVVEDATMDPRFSDNALVTGAPDIRFYAGAPIVTPNGQAIGTLCILDTQPRTLDDAARRRLADLASGVGSVLDLHRSMHRMERAATHDQLTGLANRALFEPELATAVEAALGGTPCAVLCLDLDRFKAINDAHGHAGGDTYLREAASRLREVVRASDLAARLGGDEFAILMRGPFPAYAPRLLAERIVSVFARPVGLGDVGVPIRTSIGFAVAPGDAIDGPSLVRVADTALYRAKTEGRGTVIAAADLIQPTLARGSLTLADDIRHAARTGEFTLHWQAYFAVDSGAIAGHEALLRWNRRDHGPMAPSVFIPVAEQTGAIAEIDTWVLETACAAAAAWARPHGVSIKLSPHWFCFGNITAMVAAVLGRTGLAADRLVLEITERTVIDHPDEARLRIAELRELGVRVALDDFGIGYSALGSLKAYSFDKLKLDRSFIQDLETDAKARDVARAVLALGRALRMTVCAEGVETPYQLAFLKAENCGFAQGFLLARPSAIPVERDYSSSASPSASLHQRNAELAAGTPA